MTGSEAVCAQLGPAADFIFFSTDRVNQAVAKAICAECPLVQACRDMASRAERGKPEAQRHGVFGATTPAQRYAADPGRACEDCGTDISTMHELTRRCPEDQARHRHAMKLANARIHRRVAA